MERSGEFADGCEEEREVKMQKAPGGLIWRGGEIKNLILDELHLPVRHPSTDVKLVVRYEYGSQKRKGLAGDINFGVISINDV